LKRTRITEQGGDLGKQCSKCNVWKPLDQYHKCKKGVGGVKHNCKDCKRLEGRKRNKTDRILKSVKLEEKDGILGKSCTNCNNWLPLDDFYKSAKGLGGRNSRCPRCTSINSVPYREANKEKRRENSRNWSLKNREHRTEYKRKWRKLNPDYESMWWTEHREVANIIAARRRARVKGSISDLTLGQHAKIMKHFNNSCALTLEKEDIHMDHVIPLSTGHGGTTYGNMIPLRSDLNLSKNNKNIFEWFEANRQRFNIPEKKFEKLIEYLAEINIVTTDEYRDHVYWCHENPVYFDDEEGEVI
jgi:hypothetical protein